ncbi:MAG: AAA domain-containing protein [Silicimonas sp.]|nr:AAA domain-containing protein [Silicimonas sp.]
MSEPEKLRLPAEETYAAELKALRDSDSAPKPKGWALSPQAAVTYLLGGKAGDVEISPKYLGEKRLIETAVATLAKDRALLLLGVPGTAKSWVSEHLAAAVSGDSTMVIQCTAGTDADYYGAMTDLI